MPRRPNKSRFRYTPVAENLLRSTGRLTGKSFNVLAKQNHDAATRTTRMIGIAEILQRGNFRYACCAYSSRRLQRRGVALDQWIQTDKKSSVTEQVLWWLIDVMWFLWDIVWGFFEPILTMLLYGLASVILTLVFAAILIYAIYLFLTV